MAHSHDSEHTCSLSPISSYGNCYQSMDEMNFIRGIWTAAIDGDLDRVNKLLEKGVDKRDSWGFTALHYAVRHDHVHVCKLLLENGANPNLRTNCLKTTALHRAVDVNVLNRCDELVDLLLKYGADPNLVDEGKRTPLHRVISSIPSVKESNLIRIYDIIVRLLPITDRRIRDSHDKTVDDLLRENKIREEDIGKKTAYPQENDIIERLCNLLKK